MANEVKRYIPDSTPIYLVGESTSEPTTCVVLGRDHERIVAAKDAEIANLKKSLEDSMAQVMVAVHSETNTGWPHEKKLHETIAEQKRVIERARELYINAIRLIDKYSKEKNPFNQTVTFDEVLKQYEDELEKARGAK